MKKSKKILWGGISMLLLAPVVFSILGVRYNCNKQFDQYYPLFEQSSTKIKEEFGKGNYSGARELINNQKQMFWQLDRECGEMYLLLFQRGREIRLMFEEVSDLENNLSWLE